MSRKEEHYCNPEVMCYLVSFVEKITGKKVYIEPNKQEQDLKYITCDYVWLFHEMCHWLASTEEERKHSNLGFPEESRPDYEPNLDQLINEHRACYLQWYLQRKTGLMMKLKGYGNYLRYLKHSQLRQLNADEKKMQKSLKNILEVLPEGFLEELQIVVDKMESVVGNKLKEKRCSKKAIYNQTVI